MIIKVRFFTTLREITGKREETLTFNNNQKISVATVLKNLAEKYGKDFTDYVYENETRKLKGFLQFLINGVGISNFKILEINLNDGDLLAILPPVGGG